MGDKVLIDPETGECVGFAESEASAGDMPASSPWETLADWAQERAEDDTPLTTRHARALGDLVGVAGSFWERREALYRERT